MQTDVQTPQQYLEAQENDWRLERLNDIRTLIKQKAPDLVEGINYKMLSYQDSRGTAFHLNIQKGYVSFYTGDTTKVDPKGELLEGLNIGKGCIRFKKTTALDNTRFDEFFEKAYSMWLEGKDIDC
jgi:uncharacterized protein YdhG (YjbR/CyaY superfamily)